MNCKNIFSVIVTTIFICNIHSNASFNENIRNTDSVLGNSSLSSDRMDLINNTSSNDSCINLYSSNNTLFNNKYIKLPVQEK